MLCRSEQFKSLESSGITFQIGQYQFQSTFIAMKKCIQNKCDKWKLIHSMPFTQHTQLVYNLRCKSEFELRVNEIPCVFLQRYNAIAIVTIQFRVHSIFTSSIRHDARYMWIITAITHTELPTNRDSSEKNSNYY